MQQKWPVMSVVVEVFFCPKTACRGPGYGTKKAFPRWQYRVGRRCAVACMNRAALILRGTSPRGLLQLLLLLLVKYRRSHRCRRPSVFARRESTSSKNVLPHARYSSSRHSVEKRRPQKQRPSSTYTTTGQQ